MGIYQIYYTIIPHLTDQNFSAFVTRFGKIRHADKTVSLYDLKCLKPTSIIASRG